MFTKQHTGLSRAGILLALSSSFSFSIAILLVKVVENVDPVLFVLYRGIFQFFAFLTVAIYNGHSLKKLLDRRTAVFLLLTGIFSVTKQISTYNAIKYISLSDATAILLSAPVFVTIFAYVFLKEDCGVFRSVTVILSIIGIILLSRPSILFTELYDSSDKGISERWLGFGLSVVGCVFMAAMYISLRKTENVPSAIKNSSMAIISIICAVVFAYSSGNSINQPACGLDSILVILNAIFGTLGMLLFVLATEIGEAGPLSVARTSEIMFSFIWQISILGDIPSWTSIVGVAIVILAVTLLGLQNWFLPNYTLVK